MSARPNFFAIGSINRIWSDILCLVSYFLEPCKHDYSHDCLHRDVHLSVSTSKIFLWNTQQIYNLRLWVTFMIKFWENEIKNFARRCNLLLPRSSKNKHSSYLARFRGFVCQFLRRRRVEYGNGRVLFSISVQFRLLIPHLRFLKIIANHDFVGKN